MAGRFNRLESRYKLKIGKLQLFFKVIFIGAKIAANRGGNRTVQGEL